MRIWNWSHPFQQSYQFQVREGTAINLVNFAKTYRMDFVHTITVVRYTRPPDPLVATLVAGTWKETKSICHGGFFFNRHMIMCRLRIQKMKIRNIGGFEKIEFFSLFLMRKRLSSGQKWFLRPYFPLIRGMFLLRSGLRFSFRALEVPEPRVRNRSF